MIYFLYLFSFFIWSSILNYIAHFIISQNYKNYLFPYFESFMTFCFMALWYKSSYFSSHFILFSALGITIQTDFSYMLISRFVSLYAVPSGILLSYMHYLPIHWIESIVASVIGYSFFYIINKIFYVIKKQDGMGQGDFDLMALIGAYTGLLGIWFTVLIGSLLGTTVSILYIIYKKSRITHVPFGPYLSIGAITFVLCRSFIIHYML